MNDIMLDLETMGTGPNSAIIAIGAVAFDVKQQALGQKFYTVIDLQSAVSNGGVIDAQTVLWWMKQSYAARREFEKPSLHLWIALESFTKWMTEHFNTATVRVWGDGSDFDNVILASAYRNNSMDQPWNIRNNRCYRTLKGLNPEIKLQRTGVYHNALDDAKCQAEHLMVLMKRYVGCSWD